MLRRIRAIGIGLMLSTNAMAWQAPSTDSATMQVTLTIVESCVIRTDDTNARGATARPDVACTHHAPYRVTLFDQQTPDQPFGLAKLPSSQAMQPAIWQITF